jgi:hypothetical protein
MARRVLVMAGNAEKAVGMVVRVGMDMRGGRDRENEEQYGQERRDMMPSAYSAPVTHEPRILRGLSFVKNGRSQTDIFIRA